MTSKTKLKRTELFNALISINLSKGLAIPLNFFIRIDFFGELHIIQVVFFYFKKYKNFCKSYQNLVISKKT